jgi:hypothetical protein
MSRYDFINSEAIASLNNRYTQILTSKENFARLFNVEQGINKSIKNKIAPAK